MLRECERIFFIVVVCYLCDEARYGARASDFGPVMTRGCKSFSEFGLLCLVITRVGGSLHAFPHLKVARLYYNGADLGFSGATR